MDNYEIASPGKGVTPGATAKPFSVRLTDAERRALAARAGRTPLATYIRAIILPTEHGLTPRQKTVRPTVDHEALARVLASLGRSEIAANLERLALAAQIGALDLTPEVEDEIRRACEYIVRIRCDLILALGLDESDGS